MFVISGLSGSSSGFFHPVPENPSPVDDSGSSPSPNPSACPVRSPSVAVDASSSPSPTTEEMNFFYNELPEETSLSAPSSVLARCRRLELLSPQPKTEPPQPVSFRPSEKKRPMNPKRPDLPFAPYPLDFDPVAHLRAKFDTTHAYSLLIIKYEIESVDCQLDRAKDSTEISELRHLRKIKLDELDQARANLSRRINAPPIN